MCVQFCLVNFKERQPLGDFLITLKCISAKQQLIYENVKRAEFSQDQVLWQASAMNDKASSSAARGECLVSKHHLCKEVPSNTKLHSNYIILVNK